MTHRYHPWHRSGEGKFAPHISFVDQSGQIYIELKKKISTGQERILLLTSEQFFKISFQSNSIRQAGNAINNYGTKGNTEQAPNSFGELELIALRREDHKTEHMYEWKVDEDLKVCVRNRLSDGRRPRDTNFAVEVRRFNQRDRPTDDGIMMAWHNFEGTFVHSRSERRTRIREMEQAIRSAPIAISTHENNDLPTCAVRSELSSSTDSCVICWDKFDIDGEITGLPKCSHKFHGNCIRAWLKGHNNCPLCRTKVN